MVEFFWPNIGYMSKIDKSPLREVGEIYIYYLQFGGKFRFLYGKVVGCLCLSIVYLG